MIIEATVRNYLMGILTEPVYIETPANPPASYVAIDRTGGSESETLRSARILLDSYGSSRLEAAKLHEKVLAAMAQISSLDCIGGYDLNEEQYNPDLETDRPRYQLYCDIIYY